jgi:probable HAF family extracellular repeat protein
METRLAEVPPGRSSGLWAVRQVAIDSKRQNAYRMCAVNRQSINGSPRRLPEGYVFPGVSAVVRLLLHVGERATRRPVYHPKRKKGATCSFGDRGGETMLELPRAHKIGVALAILAVLGVVQPASSQVRYGVVDLGVLEQATSGIVRGFNSANEVVGGTIGFGRGKRAFLVTNGRVENLEGLPGTDSSAALAINEDSAAVGSSNTASSIHAFIWTRRDGVQDLGTLPGDSGSQAFGINRQNEVVGYSSGEGGIEAVLWTRDGSIQGLGRLRGGDHSQAFAINEPGDVVGTSGSPGADRAFLWTRAGGMEDLGTLPGDTESSATGINNPGQVVGYSSGPSGTRAFLWTRSGGMEDLGTLPGGDSSRAFAINEVGEVVGTSGGPSGARATVWTRSGGIQDLNILIPTGSDFVLTQAVNINNPGTILAIGRDDLGQGEPHEFPTRVFLLIPGP